MSWWPYLAEGCCVAVVWLLILNELANYNRIVHQLGEKQPHDEHIHRGLFQPILGHRSQKHHIQSKTDQHDQHFHGEKDWQPKLQVELGASTGAPIEIRLVTVHFIRHDCSHSMLHLVTVPGLI